MATKKWVLDKAHTQIQFMVRHMMITSVTGSFSEYDASVETEEEDFTGAKIIFTASTASASTGNDDRDNHIKSADFFDVATYPQLKFSSTKIEKLDEKNYKLHGDMTIKNITKSFSVDVVFMGKIKDPWGNDKFGFSISGKLNRTDFDLKWNVITNTGGILVGEEVKISCEVQLVASA